MAGGAVLVLAGAALSWAVLIGVAAGLLALAVTPLFLRVPKTASWSDISAPTRVVRGTEASLEIGIDVLAGFTRWVSAVSADRSDRVFVPVLSRTESLTWSIDTARRGLYLVGPSRLEAGDPFGLMRRVLATREPSPVLVVPRVHPVDVRLGRAQTEEEETEERAGSETFHSLREYVPGDPQKLIHWKSTARTGKLMVRRMVDTTVPWLLVILDVNARAYDRPGAMFADFDAEAFEVAVEEAASWAWHGCGPGQRVLLATTAGLGISSGVTGVEVTARTRESALDALALVDPLAPEQCGPGVVAALQRRQGVSRAVYVTGAHPETSVTWLAAWRRMCPVTVVGGVK
jgi:uncharacterized protein (DUF58 family)